MIAAKLDQFIQSHQVPNLILHGPPGSGKTTLMNQFIQKLYPTKSIMMEQTMFVNCAFGKGIKFIREDMKSFAKMNTHSSFKSIVLNHADRLTADAQFALRRCIELYNHNTRYFIVTSDKYKLMKPILSRFCELYVQPPIRPPEPIPEDVRAVLSTLTPDNVDDVASQCYELAGCVADIESYVLETDHPLDAYTFLLTSSKLKMECCHEQLLMLMLLHFYVHKKPLETFM